MQGDSRRCKRFVAGPAGLLCRAGGWLWRRLVFGIAGDGGGGMSSFLCSGDILYLHVHLRQFVNEAIPPV
jgi:hypothetical protein